jgi:hypothetical protein
MVSTPLTLTTAFLRIGGGRLSLPFVQAWWAGTPAGTG